MTHRSPKFALITPYGTENNGLRMLSAVIAREGFEAHTIFFKIWRNNDVVAPSRIERELLYAHLERIAPDVVGIGFGSPYLRLVAQMSREIRSRLGVPIVVGGIHPTFAQEDCVDFADAVAVGEGEQIMAEIARRTAAGDDWRGIAGLRLRGEAETRPAPLIRDLDSLPFLDYSSDKKVTIDGRDVIPGEPYAKLGIVRLHASRGCPYVCSYCYNASLADVYGKRVPFRRRSVDSVIAEIHHAKTHLRAMRRIKFDDDTFIFPRSWIEEFCEKYPREVGLAFDVMLNPESIRAADVEDLARAGLKGVQIGVEAASEEEAAMYERKDSRKTVLEFAEQSRRLGLQVNYDIILDNPMATGGDRRAMIDLLTAMPKPIRVYLYSLNAFPKSGVHETLIEAGAMSDAEIESRSQKTFRQFRASFDWPRSAEDRAHMALAALAAKPFVPSSWVRRAARSRFLMRRPGVLVAAARIADVIRLYGIGFERLLHGEVTWAKVREYGSFRRLLTQ